MWCLCKVYLAIALLGITCCRSVDDYPESTDYRLEIPYDCLVNCRVFTSAHVGEGSDYSSYACDLSMIYHSDNRIKLLINLFNEAKHLEGKAYALAALHSVDEKIYHKFKSQLSGEENIDVMMGCLVFEKKLEDLWKDIEKENMLDDILVWPIPYYFKIENMNDFDPDEVTY